MGGGGGGGGGGISETQDDEGEEGEEEDQQEEQEAEGKDKRSKPAKTPQTLTALAFVSFVFLSAPIMYLLMREVQLSCLAACETWVFKPCFFSFSSLSAVSTFLAVSVCFALPKTVKQSRVLHGIEATVTEGRPKLSHAWFHCTPSVEQTVTGAVSVDVGRGGHQYRPPSTSTSFLSPPFQNVHLA